MPKRPQPLKYVILHWHSAPLYVQRDWRGDGPFDEWLNTHAPSGYRLVQVAVVRRITIDNPEVRECIFEAVP